MKAMIAAATSRGQAVCLLRWSCVLFFCYLDGSTVNTLLCASLSWCRRGRDCWLSSKKNVMK